MIQQSLIYSAWIRKFIVFIRNTLTDELNHILQWTQSNNISYKIENKQVYQNLFPEHWYVPFLINFNMIIEELANLKTSLPVDSRNILIYLLSVPMCLLLLLVKTDIGFIFYINSITKEFLQLTKYNM
jgi:hypothetical protein